MAFIWQHQPAAAPRWAPAPCTYLKSASIKRGCVPTWRQTFKGGGGRSSARQRQAAEEGAELSDAYKHEIKAPKPLRPEGARILSSGFWEFSDISANWGESIFLRAVSP